MVDINQKDRTIRIKIVYYGPALGGKTTNLRVLHAHALWSRRGELVSVNSMQDRTILCDLLPLRSGGFRGHDLRLQLLAVPGQAMYGATRRVVLKAADGIVFVANSAADRWDENARSYDEMNAHLIAHQLDPHTIPLVFQYNKRDLPQLVPMEALQRELNARHVPAVPAVATKGSGVLETFAAILSMTVGELHHRYRTMELPPGQSVEAWSKQAVTAMFGRERLDEVTTEEAPAESVEIELADGTVIPVGASDQIKVRVPTPEDVRRPPQAPAAPEVRSPESLAASYAEASTELGFVVSDLREERDAACRRLEEMRRALDLATESPGVADVESRLKRILQVLVCAGGATTASLRLTTVEPARFLVLPELVADPLSHTKWGERHLDALLELAEPLVEEAVDSAELTDALRASEPSFEAMVSVPLRSAERLLGLALLYYDLHAVLPSRDTLAHLGFLARELAGPLEASAAREAALAADRLQVLARASAAAVTSLLARLPPELTRRQRCELAEVLAPLRVPGVRIEVAEGAAAALGDGALLRFALASLVHLCETNALARGQAPDIVVQGDIEEGAVCVSVSGGGRTSVVSSRESGPDAYDTELSMVQAVVTLHGGLLVADLDAEMRPHFTVRLKPA